MQRARMIRHHTEETDCDYCGHPLHVGDDVVDVVPDSEPNAYHLGVYCSRYCARLDTATRPQRAAQVAGR